jgi:hypothetical protein
MKLKLILGCSSMVAALAAAQLAGCSDAGTAGTGGSSTTGGSDTTTSTAGTGGSVSSSAAGTGGSASSSAAGTGGAGTGGAASSSASSSAASTSASTSATTGSGMDAGPAPLLDINFDSAAVTYTLTGFGDEVGVVVADPTNAANKVAKLDKPNTSQPWAGTTVSTLPNNSIITLPITAMNSKMTLRAWSPDANIQVRLKVEDANDPTHSVETIQTLTTASAWQTLTFDFNTEAPGTAKLNPAFTFNRVSVFFNFGVDGPTAGAKTYYLDDLTFQ